MGQKQKKAVLVHLALNIDEQYRSEEDLDILRKYGDMQDGFTRDVVVPADITLHCMHYLIQRAFGFSNSHLHHFLLPPEVFQQMTGGTTEPDESGGFLQDGSFLKWTELCGIYFRLSQEEDQLWDDDYQEDQYFRTWLRRKYTKPSTYTGYSEYYSYLQQKVRSFMEEWKESETIPSITGMGLFDAGTAKGHPVRVEPEEAWVADVASYTQNMLDELREQIRLTDILLPEGAEMDARTDYGIELLKKFQKCTKDMLPVLPVAKSLLYEYDYGDGWQVVITLKGSFEVTDEFLAKYRRIPACVASDGLMLMDDVGGVEGYIDLLREIHEGTPEQKRQARDWAKNLWGWTGREVLPEKIL